MALWWRRSEQEILDALMFLSMPNVMWLNVIEAECPPSVPLVSAKCPLPVPLVSAACPPSVPERNENGTEREQKRTETNERTNEGSSPSSPVVSSDSSSGVAFFESLRKGLDSSPEGSGPPESNSELDAPVPAGKGPTAAEALIAGAIKPGGWNPDCSLVEVEKLCFEILGKDEMARCGSRWRKKMAQDRDKLRRVLLEMRAKELEHGKITNRGGYAEDLWKRFV
jgi:hypothetical protein